MKKYDKCSQDKIEYFKYKYGHIYKISVDGIDFIYRRISVGEFEEVNRRGQENKDVESIVLCAVLYPNIGDFKELGGGKVTLVNHIVKSSNIESEKDVESYINEGREKASKVINDDMGIWKLGIMRAFPSYKFEDFDNMMLDKFFLLLALSENIMGTELVKVPKKDNRENERVIRESKIREATELEAISASNSENALRDLWKQSKKPLKNSS